jgi:peptidoglycan-N-acetylglucosamine deacetylase
VRDHGAASAARDDHARRMPTVSLTFDVDAEVGLGADLAAHEHRLSTVSERAFGVVRGLPRIVELLRHPEAIRALVDAGHEIAHHGHHHLRSHEIDAAAQSAEIDDGLSALQPFLDGAIGYRSPAWELTPHTAALLVARGFAYDSSLMGDDRPYWLQVEAGRLVGPGDEDVHLVI